MVLLASQSNLGNLYDIIIAGGPIMWPIALCSVLALAIGIERFAALRSSKLAPEPLIEDLKRHVAAGDFAAGTTACESSHSALGQALAPGLRKIGRPLAEVEKAIEEAGRRTVKRMAGRLKALAMITSIAPMLGLLGTVWGLIICFNVIALEQGLGKPELLADGVAQALITTAAGLIVAIPTQLVHAALKQKLERFANRVEEVYDSLIEDAALGAERRAA